MKVFKKMRVVFLAIVMLFALAFGFACKGNENPTNTNGYTVTFMVEGQQYGEQLKVQKGRRITQPEDPTFETEGYVFTGWYTDDAFAADTQWNFATGIVTADMTLYAGYRVVQANVTDVAKAEEACTSKLVWTQSAVSEASAYEVKITDKYGKEETLTGTVSFDAENFKVTFTPTDVLQGGVYTVSVKDTTKTADAAVAEGILFGGAGTEENPYLIGSALDFTMVNQANVEGTYFSLANNITIETSREAQKDYVFNGTLIGNGRTITLENSNSAAIYKLGENGYVYNVNVAGLVSTALFDSVGSIVDFNAGKVEKVNTTANVESTAGLTGTNGLANALNAELADGAGNRGIAGGVVGTNLATGVIYNCKITTSSSSTGTVKAAIGGGTIVGLNYGTVEMCTSNGCFGAWNSTESGKSLSNYSYGGGIAGINAGTVTKCTVAGSAKLLAQRYTDLSQLTVGTNNANLGGVVGYNMENATVSECYFSGIRVHGDENVGGIAGLNAGVITDSYVEGLQQSTGILTYIGGRINVGGVVGKMEATGSVTNCYVTANVFCFTEGTAWAAAEKATNTVYLSANPNSKSLAANPDAVALTAPTGEGNVAVTVEANSHDGQTVDFVLAESYLTTVNGNNKFNFNNGTTIKLNFETEVLPEETMDVTLYSDGAEWATVAVAETGAAISGPVKQGYKFVGWATEANGEVVFEAAAPISLYDLQDYADVNGSAVLYAVFEVRVANEGLIVAIWDRYINTEEVGLTTSETIKEQYLAYMAANGLSYDVEFRVYTERAVADFGAAVNADGDIDVILGAGANIQTAGGVVYMLRSAMIYEGLTGRQVALLTDTERAVEFYAWATGLEDVDAEITFNVNGTETKGTVNALWGTTVTPPEVTAEEGYEFKGWATTAEATEAEVAGAEIGYAAVKELLSEGKVTLYPVFVEVVEEEMPDTALKVSVWTKGGDWVADAELEAIKKGFEGYLTAQGYDVSTLTITYVETATSKVADLGAEINAAGDFDIIIGCGNNVNTTGGVTIIEKADIVTSYVAAGRMCARITDNDLAVCLYTYLTTAVVAETYTLKVSVWTKGGDWITATEIEAIKTGFNAYLTANGYDLASVTIEWVETATSAVADLGAEVNAAGDFDIIIGCGSNVTTKGGVEVLEKADIVTSYVAAGRMCARITGNVIATLLYNYLTTTAEA